MAASVAILGCGPTGLFAAHAAVRAGVNVTVYSKPRKSFMNGAQYLHRPITGLSGRSFQIDYRLVGTADGYRAKVYGSRSPVAVSAETLVGVSAAWDIRDAYDTAWASYGPDVVAWDAAVDEIPGADLVINTIPRRLLCNENHDFAVEQIWSTDAVRYTSDFPLYDDNVVLLSGRSQDNWYRQSRIHGWENTEWPLRTFAHDGRLPGGRLWKVDKPIRTNCTCNPEVSNVGRYGRWTKGVLADSGYYETQDLIRDLKGAKAHARFA